MDASPPIIAAALWQMDGGARDHVLELVAELRRQTLAEAGCLGYEVYKGIESSDVFLLERYVDAAAIESHRASAHYQDLVVRQILPLLTNRRVELLNARETKAS
jgi:quinol monooxygenase YgiN